MLLAKRLWRGWRSDERGSLAVFFILAGTVVFGISGAAIDYTRWINARQHTARAMDAAVLAGARALQLDHGNPAAALTIAKQVYDSNVIRRLKLSTDTVQFVTSDNNLAITATGNATLQTTVLGIVGVRELPVLSATGSKFPKAKITAGGGGSSNIEVALMLDVTGSMCDDGNGPCTTGTKIQGLKDAAKGLVNIVVLADQSTYTSRVALVPFTTTVRVGPDGGGTSMMNALTDLQPSANVYSEYCTQWTGSWGTYDSETGTTTGYTVTCTQTQVVQENLRVIPCVTDRMYNTSPDYNYTDVAPGSGHWLLANGGSRWPLGDDAGSSPVTGSLGTSASSPAWQWNYNGDGSCWENAPGNEIMPLNSDKTALTAKIDGLQAYGSTSGALGTAFAWYMLSPNWNGIWTGQGRPGNYSDLTQIQANGRPKLRKVAVLMTDGGYNTWRGWKSQNQQDVSNHAVQLCTNMKAAGVEVYTVGFALNELPAGEAAIARATLQACGTDLSHFYETLNVQQLQDAFTEIAMSLSTVYLSE